MTKVIVTDATSSGLQIIPRIQELCPLGAGWHNVRVFLKPNLTFPSHRPGVTTAPRFIEQVIVAFKELGACVAVGEGDGGYGSWSAETGFAGHNLYELCNHYGVSLVNLSKDRRVAVPMRLKGDQRFLDLPRILIEDTDLFVTLPVPKIHCMTTYSGAVKNQWGCIPDNFRLRYHPDFNEMIWEVNKAVKAKLVLADATYSLDVTGPMFGQPIYMNRTVIANDILACDTAFASRCMGLHPESITHLKAGLLHGFQWEPDEFIDESTGPIHQFTMKRTMRSHFVAAAFPRQWAVDLLWFSKAGDVAHKVLYTFAGNPVKDDRDRVEDFESSAPANTDSIKSVDECRLKKVQTNYYEKGVDQEFEIRRPHGTPRLYEALLDEKFRRSIAAFEPIRGKSALTVCGGSGMDAEFLARSGAITTASDLSAAAVQRARERFGRFLATKPGQCLPSVTTADVEHLPFPDRSIDLVYVHDGLHHLEDPSIGLREMCRVASWAVSLTEPADAAFTAIAVKLGRAEEIEEAGNRVARLDLPTVTRILESEGFTVVRAQRYAMYYKHKPGWVMRLLSLPVLNSLAWLAFDLGNLLIGRWGNKMTVQAIRTDSLSPLRRGKGRG